MRACYGVTARGGGGGGGPLQHSRVLVRVKTKCVTVLLVPDASLERFSREMSLPLASGTAFAAADSAQHCKLLRFALAEATLDFVAGLYCADAFSEHRCLFDRRHTETEEQLPKETQPILALRARLSHGSAYNAYPSSPLPH